MVGLEDGESEFERLFFDRGALRPQVASRRAVRLGDNAGDFKIVLIEFPESGKGEFGSAEKNYIHKIIRLCEVGGRGNPSFARLLRRLRSSQRHHLPFWALSAISTPLRWSISCWRTLARSPSPLMSTGLPVSL